jgi:hypothetical protein
MPPKSKVANIPVEFPAPENSNSDSDLEITEQKIEPKLKSVTNPDKYKNKLPEEKIPYEFTGKRKENLLKAQAKRAENITN